MNRMDTDIPDGVDLEKDRKEGHDDDVMALVLASTLVVGIACILAVGFVDLAASVLTVEIIKQALTDFNVQDSEGQKRLAMGVGGLGVFFGSVVAEVCLFRRYVDPEGRAQAARRLLAKNAQPPSFEP